MLFVSRMSYRRHSVCASVRILHADAIERNVHNNAYIYYIYVETNMASQKHRVESHLTLHALPKAFSPIPKS